MSTYHKILHLADTLIQQRGFLGFSYADLEKKMGIKKASIHYHFPGKNDLGLAYCKYKTDVFEQLNEVFHEVTPGMQRFKAYLDAFAGCAKRGEMCGIYAMLSDSNQFSPELQEAVSRLANFEILILEDILISGLNSGEIKPIAPSNELAIVVCSALKGALMLNRIPPHNAYLGAVDALMLMLDARTDFLKT